MQLLVNFFNYIFNFMSSVDPQTEKLLKKVQNIVLPIIYAVAGFALIVICIRYAFKISSEPEEKGTYIKHWIWVIFGILCVFLATGIANIITAKYLGLI